MNREELDRELLMVCVDKIMSELDIASVEVDSETIEMFECRGRTYFYEEHSSGARQIQDCSTELATAILAELKKKFD